jgi:UDP-N-acetylmuramoyl-tripeptide--D-alanyl-D-alanine ligase
MNPLLPKWGEIKARDVVRAITGEQVGGNPETVFAGLSTDSRAISGGELFWALKGEKYDGHDFATEALRRGASGVLAHREFALALAQATASVVIGVKDSLKSLGDLAKWWRQQHAVQVAAITGSAGKTTTKEMAACILETRARTLKNTGNFNNLIGLPLTLLQLEESHGLAVLEMGMNRPGEIARLTDIADPNLGLITKIGKAHLEGVGDIMGVARAKVEMLESMSPDGQMILNGDDPILMMVAAPFRKRAIRYGLGSENNLRAEKIENHGRDGTSFDLLYQGKTTHMRINVPGTHQVLNALAAAAIAICLGQPPEQITWALGRFKGVDGRFQFFSLPGGVNLVDDTYNANPSSLRAALESILGLAGDPVKVIVGLGDMLELGDEAEPAHREAGYMVAELGFRFLMAMGDHAGLMIEGAVEAGFPRERALVVGSHEEMVERIKGMMRRGDYILLKGSRRMRLEQVSNALRNQHAEEVSHDRIEKDTSGR